MSKDESADCEARELKEAAADHLVKLAKAGFQAAPLLAATAANPHFAALLAMFGPSLASLVGDYLPSRAQQKRLTFLVELGRQIEELRDEQKKMVTTDQFAMLFHRVASEVGIEANEEKIRTYRDALISSLTLDVEDALQDAYVEALRSLNPLHLEILRAIWVDCRPKWLSYTYPGGDAVIEGKDLITALPERPAPLLYEFIHDLAVKGLVVHLGDRGDWTLPSDDPETLNCAVTNFGIGLLAFITPEHPAPDFLLRRRVSESLPIENQPASMIHLTTES